jgi:hypothetical protein
MNQASDMLVVQILAFFGKKVTILRKKKMKMDNFMYSIKKTKQAK